MVAIRAFCYHTHLSYWIVTTYNCISRKKTWFGFCVCITITSRLFNSLTRMPRHVPLLLLRNLKLFSNSVDSKKCYYGNGHISLSCPYLSRSITLISMKVSLTEMVSVWSNSFINFMVVEYLDILFDITLSIFLSHKPWWYIFCGKLICYLKLICSILKWWFV